MKQQKTMIPSPNDTPIKLKRAHAACHMMSSTTKVISCDNPLETFYCHHECGNDSNESSDLEMNQCLDHLKKE